MDEVDIRMAFRERLDAMPGRPPVVWENVEADLSPPYLIFDTVSAPGRRVTLDGVRGLVGMVQVSIVIAQGVGAPVGERIARQVAAHFPSDADLGGFRLVEPPDILDGYPDSGEYRIPVQIRYRITTK